MNRFIIVIFSFVLATSLTAQLTYRYTDSLFAVEELLSPLTYATAPELNSPYFGESFTHDEELSMRLFRPVNDNLSQRPMLICIHGGAFVSGNPNHDDMIAFCELFASRGYVTATIQYRLGMNPLSASSSERAVYRGLQDSRAAIRYIKENADEFEVDTNHVYMLGSSAGSFVALHNLFMNTDAERPSSAQSNPDLGGYDAIENQYNHNAHPDAVIALWGALQATDLIQPGDEEIPVFLIHGTEDDIVPFGLDHPFQFPLLPQTYGSQSIAERFVEIGYPHETYFVEGEDHEFYGASNGNWSSGPNEYWDTISTRSINFLYKHHKPTANFAHFTEGNSVSFTDQSTENIIGWHWDFGDGETSDEQNPVHEYATEGEYKVRLAVQNEIQSWDTISSTINITITSIAEYNSTLPKEFELSQNYPNPFNPITTIKYTIPEQDFGNQGSTKISLKIIDALGRIIATLVNEHQLPGNYSMSWDASNNASGIYYYRLQSSNYTETKKMVLLR